MQHHVFKNKVVIAINILHPGALMITLAQIFYLEFNAVEKVKISIVFTAITLYRVGVKLTIKL